MNASDLPLGRSVPADMLEDCTLPPPVDSPRWAQWLEKQRMDVELTASALAMLKRPAV